MSAILKLTQVPVKTGWCPEVDVVLSALDASRCHGGPDRRSVHRRPHRVPADLRLFADGPRGTPWELFSRDVDARGLGFVCRDRLPLGYGGLVELEAPDRTPILAPCTVYRCRECGPDWYEGSLYFHQPQPALNRLR